MNSDNAMKELTLLNLARVLADELRYINYPKEWSNAPLKNVFSCLVSVLNNHPAKLGNILEDAFEKTLPKTTQGNVNQLNSIHTKLFGKDRQYYLDMYDVKHFESSVTIFGVDLSHEISGLDKDDTEKQLIASLATTIVNAFKSLSADKIDEHRTLEHVTYAVTPVCYASGLVGIGFDLSEYADQWRTLNGEERKHLAADITSRWA